MGKGRILTAHGEGRYTIEILEDRARAEARKATAEQRITQIDSRISELEADLSAAQSEVDSAAAAQDQAIDDYQAALADDQVDDQAEAEARDKMVKAGEAIIQAAAQRDAISRNIRALELERLTLQARIDQINALPPLRQQEAWCADYTEDLGGDVATAEVPGEIGQVIIQPGFDDGAAWSPADDGAIQPALSGTPASVFYNLAMMPGWQKWRPTFRIATISNIDNDLCDISLDSATSSQQGLNVNAQGSYSGVPIMYMDCNGDAFEDGDRVLVAFSGNTDAPMVVGFEKEPKECATPFIGDLSFQQAEVLSIPAGASRTGPVVLTGYGGPPCPPPDPGSRTISIDEENPGTIEIFPFPTSYSPFVNSNGRWLRESLFHYSDDSLSKTINGAGRNYGKSVEISLSMGMQGTPALAYSMSFTSTYTVASSDYPYIDGLVFKFIATATSSDSTTSWSSENDCGIYWETSNTAEGSFLIETPTGELIDTHEQELTFDRMFRLGDTIGLYIDERGAAYITLDFRTHRRHPWFNGVLLYLVTPTGEKYHCDYSPAWKSYLSIPEDQVQPANGRPVDVEKDQDGNWHPVYA